MSTPVSTPADLSFRARIQRELMAMVTMCREKRSTYRTPEYRADTRNVLEDTVRWLEERSPDTAKPAGVEFEWGQPAIELKDDRYVAVLWRDQQANLATEEFPTVPWQVTP